MFLDASAMIAILEDEDDAGDLLAKIELSSKPVYYSALSVYEAVVGLARKKTILAVGDQEPTPPHMIDQAQKIVEGFLSEIGALEMTVGDGIHKKALMACRTFGRAVAHPARLNFGDCFSYACAKSHRIPLLYKGNDFPKTDIETA